MAKIQVQRSVIATLISLWLLLGWIISGMEDRIDQLVREKQELSLTNLRLKRENKSSPSAAARQTIRDLTEHNQLLRQQLGSVAVREVTIAGVTFTYRAQRERAQAELEATRGVVLALNHYLHFGPGECHAVLDKTISEYLDQEGNEYLELPVPHPRIKQMLDDHFLLTHHTVKGQPVVRIRPKKAER